MSKHNFQSFISRAQTEKSLAQASIRQMKIKYIKTLVPNLHQIRSPHVVVLEHKLKRALAVHK